MVNKIKNTITTALYSWLLLPVWVSADDDVDGLARGGVRLNNPLGEGSTITTFLQDILEVIMVFAVPLIVFMIIYAGFTYVMARGNPAKVGDASRALMYAVIGGVIILGAWAILTVIQGTVDAFRR